jgi:hypothetical protein
MGYLDIRYNPLEKRAFDLLEDLKVVPAFRNALSAPTLIETPKVRKIKPLRHQGAGTMIMSGKNIWANTIMIIDINKYAGGSILTFFMMRPFGEFYYIFE